jgi:hypothetical protein
MRLMTPTFLMTAAIFCCFHSYGQHGIGSGFFREEFNDTAMRYFRYGSTGNPTHDKWTAGVVSPTGPHTKILSLKIDPEDSAGPGRGPEIISRGYTHFGTYSSRLQVPRVADIQPNIGAVVGYFTYHLDSIAGLSEIDFEWLIADPSVIYIGTWTGTDNNRLKRIGRTINLANGTIYTTEYKEGYNGTSTPLVGAQNQPEKISAIEGYDAAATFYTYGFDWYPDRLRWWIINPADNKKIVLWDYRGSLTGIPQNPSEYRMNFWHTNNWSVQTNMQAIEKPKHPYELQVDWMEYKPRKQRRM